MNLYTEEELENEVSDGRSLLSGRHAKWQEEAATLKANPGVWGEIENAPKNMAGNVATGKLKSFTPRGAWQSRTRQGRVFVRYVGE